MDSEDVEEREDVAEQDMTEEFDDIRQLNETIYELYGRLHENAELMTEAQFDMISDKLYELYEKEEKRIHERYDIERKREEFKHRERSAALVPHAWRFLFLHRENVAAKLIMEAVDINTNRFFEASEAENDENRPEYMPKMYLSRAQKREAKREARSERRRERKAEKEKRARLRKLEQDRKRQKKKDSMKAKRDAELEARRKRREARQAKRKARQELRRQRAAENAKRRKELRQKQRERRKQTTSPKSPKTGTKKVRSASMQQAAATCKSPISGKEKKHDNKQ